jgi:hypothetical protein
MATRLSRQKLSAAMIGRNGERTEARKPTFVPVGKHLACRIFMKIGSA